MFSPVSAFPPTNIGLCWTDEEVVMCLMDMIQGSSTPQYVTEDVNPYQLIPSNLPDDIWYFIRSEQKKDSEHGFWKARGEACKIHANSAITGWRSTLEFYEGRAPHGRRTNWMMQEYRITQNGLHNNSNPKDSSLLCRVFLSGGASSDHGMQQKLGGAEIPGSNHFDPRPSVGPDTGSMAGQGHMNDLRVRNRDDNTRPLAAAGVVPDISVENTLDNYILEGDFLELDDLAESFSSDNTSCVTLTSDDCFDSFLQDLEEELNRDEQGKDANCKFSVAASARPNEVVMMQPATSGSLISRNGRNSPPTEVIDKKILDKKVPKNAIKSQKSGNGNEGTSNSHNRATSSHIHKTAPKGKKDLLGIIKTLKRWCLCFWPF